MSRALTFHLIPHVHWDREWYLPRAAFLARLAGTARALADLLATDPAACFTLDGQTILWDDALAVVPELDAALRRAVSERRLALGPWYLLADEQIPCGESLVRNLLIGTTRAREVGARLDVLYSPDAFGHPAALPMLAREFGIERGVVWRGLGGSEETGDFYRWAAPSGDDILLYHLPQPGYEIGAELPDAGAHLAATWRPLRELLVNRALTPHIAVFVGADHHAPPTELSSLRDALADLEKDHTVVIDTLDGFFGALSARQRFPELEGELRWSYGYTWTLQGVHGTRSRMKRRHALAELRLSRLAEPLTALALAHGLDQRGTLQLAWQTLVQCQFHDTLGGCAADPVAAEQDVRLTSVEAVADELRREALAFLTGHDADRARQQPHRTSPTLLLWNPVPRARAGIVTAEVTCFRRDVLVGPPAGRVARSGNGFVPFVLVDRGRKEIPVQVLGVERSTERIDAARHYPDQDEVDRVHVAFVADTLEGLDTSALRIEPGEAQVERSELRVSDESLSNRFVSVTVGADGAIRMKDLHTGEEYPDLLRLEDQADEGDSYTVYLPGEPVSHETTPISRRATVDGPLLGRIEARWNMRGSSQQISCRLLVELRADSPLVRLLLEVENAGSNHRLRARLPVGAGGEALAGAAFGFERRPAEAFNPADYPAETPVLTAPAHRYVAAGAANRGLALLAPGFFEYEWTPRRDLIFTVLRSVGELSRADLPTRPGHAGWPTSTPGAQEHGMHRIELALTPWTGESIESPAWLESQWEDAFMPLLPAFIRDFSGSLDGKLPAGITLEGDGLVCSAIKPPENGEGIVLRCFNTTERAVVGAWRVGSGIGEARLLRADESLLKQLAVTDGNAVSFSAPARRIVTIGVTPRQ